MTQDELNRIVETVIETLTQNSVDVQKSTIENTVRNISTVVAYNTNGDIVRISPSSLTSEVSDLLSRKTKMIVDLGTVSSSSVAEDASKSYASNPDVILLVYKTNTGQQGYIRQIHNTLGNTLQFLTLNGVEYVRTVNYGSGLTSRWYDITGASLIHQLRYDAGSCKISFWNPIQDETFGGVEIPIATTTASGLLSATDKDKLDNASTLRKITWSSSTKLYRYTTSGEYEFSGTKYEQDDLPNTIPTDATFTARMTVLYVNMPDSTAANAKTVIQILHIADSSNKFGGTFVRGAQASALSQITGGNGWSDWTRQIYKGAQVDANEVSNNVVADVNISTKSDNVQIVTKSWGENNWNTRATILSASTNRAGVMTAQMYQDLVNLKTQVANLQSELNKLKGQ